ncbi:MAG: hypothetical protein H7A20_05020 [Rhodanobacteraceae bacterium]|nr:hypothetical protein [Rhodanobacteraceae bacterium]
MGARLGEQSNEAGRAHGVHDQVDPLGRIRIQHVMASTGIEHPAFPSRHVGFGVAADEADMGSGNDRDVDAQVILPVVVQVTMRGGFAAAFDAHQARTPDHGIKACHDLMNVRQTLQ